MATEKTVKAVVLRDYWPTENEEERVRAGTIQDVSKDAMIEGLQAGFLAKAPDEA